MKNIREIEGTLSTKNKNGMASLKLGVGSREAGSKYGQPN